MSEQGEPQVPTKEEIEKLPRWAQVAFAARIARMVQPLLLTHGWISREQARVIERPLSLAEQFAARPPITASRRVVASAFRELVIARDEIEAISRELATHGTEVSVHVAQAVAAAADAAADALTAIHDVPDGASGSDVGDIVFDQSHLVPSHTFDGVYSALHACVSYDSSFRTVAAGHIGRDFELLVELAKGGEGIEAWTDETPVPPEVFGPMWPEGAPEGWPDESREDRPLRVFTAEMIDALPPRHRVALVARMARRVLPVALLGVESLPDHPGQDVEARMLEQAVDHAEEAGAGVHASGLAVLDAVTLERVFGLLKEQAIKPNATTVAVAVGSYFAGTVIAGATRAAADVFRDEGVEGITEVVVKAARGAEEAAAQFAASDADIQKPAGAAIRAAVGFHTRRAMLADYDLLAAASSSPEQIITSGFFGPIWPEGVPEGWPSEGSANTENEQCLVIDVEVPEGTDDEEVEARIAALIAAASARHVAHGGSGLKLRGLEIGSYVHAGTGDLS